MDIVPEKSWIENDFLFGMAFFPGPMSKLQGGYVLLQSEQLLNMGHKPMTRSFQQGDILLPIPMDPCMVYLPTFGWFLG